MIMHRIADALERPFDDIRILYAGRSVLSHEIVNRYSATSASSSHLAVTLVAHWAWVSSAGAAGAEVSGSLAGSLPCFMICVLTGCTFHVLFREPAAAEGSGAAAKAVDKDSGSEPGGAKS